MPAIPSSARVSRRTLGLAALLVLALVIALAVKWGGSGGSSVAPAPGSSGSTTSVAPAPYATTGATIAPAGSSSGCRTTAGTATVAVGDLPQQARDTLAEIAAGPPYRYHQDGVVFQNRERVLPAHAGGYYHEFTVVTPGSADRGARRIIVGSCGERWYTDDHYITFRLIEGG